MVCNTNADSNADSNTDIYTYIDTYTDINSYYDTAHFNLGLLYYNQGEIEKAVDWWQKTIAINPEYFSAHINLALYYYQQKEFNKAIYHCNEVLKRGGIIPLELLQGLRSQL